MKHNFRHSLNSFCSFAYFWFIQMNTFRLRWTKAKALCSIYTSTDVLRCCTELVDSTNKSSFQRYFFYVFFIKLPHCNCYFNAFWIKQMASERMHFRWINLCKWVSVTSDLIIKIVERKRKDEIYDCLPSLEVKFIHKHWSSVTSIWHEI